MNKLHKSCIHVNAGCVMDVAWKRPKSVCIHRGLSFISVLAWKHQFMLCRDLYACAAIRKTKFKELDLLNLPEDCDHGLCTELLTELLPIQKNATNCQYFEAQLSDGTKSIKVVAFDSFLYLLMNTLQKDWKAIKVTNSRVRKKQNKEDVHIFINNQHMYDLHSPLVQFHWVIHSGLQYLQNMDKPLLKLYLGYSITKKCVWWSEV